MRTVGLALNHERCSLSYTDTRAHTHTRSQTHILVWPLQLETGSSWCFEAFGSVYLSHRSAHDITQLLAAQEAVCLLHWSVVTFIWWCNILGLGCLMMSLWLQDERLSQKFPWSNLSPPKQQGVSASKQQHGSSPSICQINSQASADQRDWLITHSLKALTVTKLSIFINNYWFSIKALSFWFSSPMAIKKLLL